VNWPGTVVFLLLPYVKCEVCSFNRFRAMSI